MSSTDSQNASSEKKALKGKKKVAEAAVEDTAAVSMSLSQLSKEDVVKKFRRSDSDTGSPEVQVALITQRLENLTKHFSGNSKDYHSQRGMMGLISQRKRLLNYLRSEDVNRYRSTLSALGLRK